MYRKWNDIIGLYSKLKIGWSVIKRSLKPVSKNFMQFYILVEEQKPLLIGMDKM